VFNKSIIIVFLAGLLGCGTEQAKRSEEFHTSGSHEADQRAEQRITKTQQMRGEGEDDSASKAAAKPLFDRLGGQAGIDKIVGDFVGRAIVDPRINWKREGVLRGGVMGMGKKPVGWEPNPANLARLKIHMSQFITLATGGPARYEGKGMKEAHQGMRINNAEFDAAVGDLKASLDNLAVPTPEQKELLAIIESTRPQIVGER
jgi:hemoglobin